MSYFGGGKKRRHFVSPKEYTEMLVRELYKIDYITKEQAVKAAMTQTILLLKHSELAIRNIKYHEEVLRELTAILIKVQ